MKSISETSKNQLVFSGDVLLPQRRLPAWALSTLLHTFLIVALLLLVRGSNNGAGNVENRTGGIVLVQTTAEVTEFLSEGEISESSVEQSPQPPPLPSLHELPTDLPGMKMADTPISGVGQDFADSLTGADALLSGQGSDRPLGGKVTTEVFGVQGTGSVFVYVFDRSASMEDLGGRPLRAAKRQLKQSLASLGENQQFQIIFYNDETRVSARIRPVSTFFCDTPCQATRGAICGFDPGRIGNRPFASAQKGVVFWSRRRLFVD